MTCLVTRTGGDGVDDSGHPIPERGRAARPRPTARRAEREWPVPTGPHEQPAPVGRRAPVVDGPVGPVAPGAVRTTAMPPSQPRPGRPTAPRRLPRETVPPRPPTPGRRPPALPPEPPVGRAPSAPLDPHNVDAPTTVTPATAAERGGMPLARPPVQPRRSVTRKPKRGEPRAGTKSPDWPNRKERGARAERIERIDDVEDDPPPRRRSLGKALLATLAATVLPGTGHLILRRRTGWFILGLFLLAVGGLAAIVLSAGRAALLQSVLSSRTLVVIALGCLLAALLWVATIVRTYLIARPSGLAVGQQLVGVLVVAVLCLTVSAPLAFGANLANAQRSFLNDLFPSTSGGTAATEAIAKPRLNVLLVGSDAGPDRTGTRTDTMMVASVDTRSGRTTLFALPRNIEYAQFPPDSDMAEEFPDGFHDADQPDSGDYLLNAVYAYGLQYPDLAPDGPTADPGLNLLHQTIAYMLGLDLDYYVEVNMAGFESIIDAVGGLTVDVGPEPVPVGGITPSGRRVKPDYYIPAGIQQLSGKDTLAYARSRTDSTDYTRMGRQRCLLQNLLTQKSPADLLANFQSIAAATTNSVATNVPQEVLPPLIALAGENGLNLESVSFDPNSLPDPESPDGRFRTGKPNFPYMREVVQDAINGEAPAAAPAAPGADGAGAVEDSPAADVPDDTADTDTAAREAADQGTAAADEINQAPPATSAPTSLAASC